MTSQDDYHKTSVRMPKELHAALTQAAIENGRSLNSEILARLSESTINAKLDNLQVLVRRVLDTVTNR